MVSEKKLGSTHHQRSADKRWAKVRDAIDDRLHQKVGTNQHTKPDEKEGPAASRRLDSSEVSSRSREGRRRTLKRYADDGRFQKALPTGTGEQRGQHHQWSAG